MLCDKQTCVALAARGTRDLDSGQEQVDDRAATRQINRQARRVFAESILGAALLTALALPRRR
jgi:beta-lactamase regulating signal transducer with metallopeptidase domain